jgi:hypothetical protein
MSRHRYPVCPTSGKIRYGERKDVKLAMRQADCDRSRARLNDVACSRYEVRSYSCSDCRGWHLTSKPARPVLLAPLKNLSVLVPETAAQAMLRMVTDTGLLVGAAA